MADVRPHLLSVEGRSPVAETHLAICWESIGGKRHAWDFLYLFAKKQNGASADLTGRFCFLLHVSARISGTEQKKSTDKGAMKNRDSLGTPILGCSLQWTG